MDISRLQRYLRHMAGGMYDAVRVPGFTAFFHATDDMRHMNYAIPNADWGRSADPGFVELCREFEARSRVPRLEFVEEFAPTLPGALRDASFSEEYRGPTMLCPSAALLRPPDVPGLSIERADRDDDARLRELVCAQREGFGAPVPWVPSEGELADSRAALADGAAFVGRVAGRVVGAAQLTPPHDGLAELAGVATLEAYRRRGIATALSAATAAYAFESGLEAVCLSAGDAGSTRVYERAGFRVIATMLAYARDERPDVGMPEAETVAPQ